MARRTQRIRIDDNGGLEVVDPSYDSLHLLRRVDPAFCIKQGTLPGFGAPRFLRLREVLTGIREADLDTCSEEDSWSIHDRLNDHCNSQHAPTIGDRMLTLLQLKAALAHRLLRNCRLCARRCGVDRTKGERGVCGLGLDAYVAEHFVHIAEESPINPSLVLNLWGCGLRCCFCQQHRILEGGAHGEPRLDAALWSEMDVRRARSLSFVGGNPDESLHAILKFLDTAPTDWNLPVVWNCHGYETEEVLSLLHGVVDAYIPDLKYMSEVCGRTLSNVPGYPDAVRTSIPAMLKQDVPVYVRILVLPGHFDCCHRPALDFLAGLNNGDNLFVSVRGQYCPDWKVIESDGELARRSTREEIQAVVWYAEGAGLKLVN